MLKDFEVPPLAVVSRRDWLPLSLDCSLVEQLVKQLPMEACCDVLLKASPCWLVLAGLEWKEGPFEGPLRKSPELGPLSGSCSAEENSPT